jgi:dethiobiotin synthetase
MRARYDCLVVEGAGGLLVPITPQDSIADLAQRCAIPLLIVARAALGTINHTRLTLEAARARHLGVAGVVISHSGGALPPAEVANLALLRDELGTLWLGEIPPLAAGALPDPESLDLDALIERAALR